MDWDISVSLLVPVVLGDIVEIVPSDDDGSLHFSGDHDTLENLAPDGDVGGEGALLIDVLGFDGFLGGFESESDVLEVSDTGASLFSEEFLAVQEDSFLFLE